MNVESGSIAPYDTQLAAAGLIVAHYEEHLVGYENTEELLADPGWVEVCSFTEPRIRFVQGWNPVADAKPIYETRLVWRWA
jgi:hypothetical protein